jgi:predicted amidohydrolase
MADTVRIAGCSFEPGLMKPADNLNRMAELLTSAAEGGARLVIFPEAAFSGYGFDSPAEADPWSEVVPGPSLESLLPTLRRTGCHAIWGTLERDGDALFNTAVLAGPDGYVGHYRKQHLPFLGMDRFTRNGGEPSPVFDLGYLRVAMLICYDLTFPEATRSAALDGADLIALPTNWPPGAETTAAHVVPARAIENNVYVAAVNRVGSERGFPFIGRSSICDPFGRFLAEQPEPLETILFAEIDPEFARRKRIVRVPDKHIIDRFADRRPELYGRLTERT